MLLVFGAKFSLFPDKHLARQMNAVFLAKEVLHSTVIVFYGDGDELVSVLLASSGLHVRAVCPL